MGLRILGLLALLGMLVMQAPSSADAQCSFNAPAKAKGLKADLVRAYASCPGLTFPSPNSATMAGVPACAPGFPVSDYSFHDTRGKCSLRFQQKAELQCSDGFGVDCAAFTTSLKCKGIFEPDGETLANTSGWELSFVLRATFDDAANGDMTTMDVPVVFVIPSASNGSLTLKLREAGCISCPVLPLFGPILPACTQMEILQARVLDPAGRVFAVLGSSTR